MLRDIPHVSEPDRPWHAYPNCDPGVAVSFDSEELSHTHILAAVCISAVSAQPLIGLPCIMRRSVEG